MKKISILFKISLLVSGLLAVLLVLAGFFIANFNDVIRASKQEVTLRQFEADLITHWNELKSQYELSKKQAPEFFSKKIEQGELEAIFEQGRALEIELAEHLSTLDNSIKESWDKANTDEGGNYTDFIKRFDENLASAQKTYSEAVDVWIAKGSWNQRTAADKGLQAAMDVIETDVAEFGQRFGALVSMRSADLILSQQATIRGLMISLSSVILIAVLVSFTVLRKLKADLHDIVSLTNQLAAGDLTNVYQPTEKGDEVDEVKRAVATMTGNLRSILQIVVELAEHLKGTSQSI